MCRFCFLPKAIDEPQRHNYNYISYHGCKPRVGTANHLLVNVTFSQSSPCVSVATTLLSHTIWITGNERCSGCLVGRVGSSVTVIRFTLVCITILRLNFFSTVPSSQVNSYEHVGWRPCRQYPILARVCLSTTSAGMKQASA